MPFQSILSVVASSIKKLLEKYLQRDGLTVGMNVSGTANWLTSRPFANLMFYASKWTAYSAQTGTAIAAIAGQQQGLLTTTSPTDEFTLTLNDVPNANGAPLPSGTYTVLNPDGLTLKIYVPGGSDLLAWTSATKATFNYIAGTTGRVAIAVRGSVTNNNGNLAVLLPGHEASWNAGNIWNSEFLDFYSGSGFKMIRCMDMLNSMWRVDDEWPTRSLPGKLTLHPRTSGNSMCMVPWEYLIDLATRLNIPLMINVPVRASSAYVTALANLFQQSYPANLQLFVEGIGNEIWNTASAFQNATRWVEYYNFTKYVAALDYTTGIVTLPAHGMATGDHIFAFLDASDWGLSGNAGTDPLYWAASRGEDLLVEVLDANTFKMRYWPSSQTPKPFLTFTTYPKATVTFIKAAEAGKSPAMDVNYSTICMRNWSIFDGILGRDRCVHILASQAVNPSTTTARLAVPGATAATDVVAIAPYFGGSVFGIKLTPVAGGVAPGVWAFYILGQSKADAYAAIFPSGVTPTVAQIKSAAGVSVLSQFTLGGAPSDYGLVTDNTTWSIQWSATGLKPVSGQSYTVVYKYQVGSSSFTRVQAITRGSTATDSLQDTNVTSIVAVNSGGTWDGSTFSGGQDYSGSLAYYRLPTLSATDGTQVTVWVTVQVGSQDMVLYGTVTVGAGQASVEVQPSYAEHAKRVREDVMVKVAGNIKAQVTAAGSIPLMNYECGSHCDVTAPGALMGWHTNYMHSAEHAAVMKEYVTHMSQWIKLIGWFADVGVDNANTTCWAVATSYKTAEWSVDTRYNALKSLNGYVPRAAPLQIESVGAVSNIYNNPGAVFKVMDLPGDASHYIYAGNSEGAYSISGNAVYGDPTKINWAKPISTALVIHGVVSGAQIGRGIVSVPTGDSWYAGDSLFAWSTIDDTDTAAVNPAIGNVVAKVSTPAAVAVGGLWDMDSAAYNGAGLTAALVPSKPILIAAVLDKDNHVATYVNALLAVGGGQGVSFQVNASVANDIRAIIAASNGSATVTFPTTTAGAHVYWFYSDGVGSVQCGVDQNNGTTSTALALSASGTMGTTVVIGSNASTPRSLMKHGSMMVLNRTGLTLAQAKALVAKIQTLHSIA